MRGNCAGDSFGFEVDRLHAAEREKRLQQEIAELRSRRQPSPENLRNYEALEANLKATARELRLVRSESTLS